MIRNFNAQRAPCLLAGACYHAVGYLQSAVRDYEAAWETAMKVTGAGTKMREEALGCQWLSFYQRELALYTFAHLDRPTSEFCPDRDLHPIMKGASCRALSQQCHGTQRPINQGNVSNMLIKCVSMVASPLRHCVHAFCSRALVQKGPAQPGDAGDVQGAGPHPDYTPCPTAAPAT